MKISNIAKRMIFTILVIALLCTLGSILYYRSLGFLPFLFGTVLGTGISIFKVLLLERTVDKAITLEGRNASNYVSLQHVLRLFLSGIVLVLGALVPQISLWGVVAGILAFQLAVYSVRNTK